MASKLSLNLFGEIIIIDCPTTLVELREIISEKFVFKKSDTEELILLYSKESKIINIKSEEDYKIFLNSKISQIIIDISKNSYISHENIMKLKNEKEIDDKKINELIKQNEEYKKLLSTQFIPQEKQIIEISKQIQELYDKRKKLIKYIKTEKGKLIKMKKNNDKAIDELGKKLSIKNYKHNTLEKDIISYKKRSNNITKQLNKKRQNTLQNLKLAKIIDTNSYENRKTSPFITSSQISIKNSNHKSNNKINYIRKRSPLLGHDAGKEKKISNNNDNKNNINPFNEENEENKNQKQKFEKIAEIICNRIKGINVITNDNDKNQIRNNSEKKEKTIKIKDKKEIQKKHQFENKKIIVKNNDIVKKHLINGNQKYEHLINSSKEIFKSLNIKKQDDNNNGLNSKKKSKNSYNSRTTKNH